MTTEQINEVFTYHAPSKEQQVKYVTIRDKAKELANLINDNCPESREKSLAITHIQIANMMANASIAIHTT
jgi:hypothetical protein